MASLAPEERFEMGRGVNRAFGAIGRNAPLFLAMAVLLQLVPFLLIRLVVGTPFGAAGPDLKFPLVFFITTILSYFLSCLLQAAVNYAIVTDLNGQRPAFARSMLVGVRYAVPLFFLAVVSLLGIYAGMILLFVPGIILGLMWSVATPAMVNEDLGILASLGRSRALTKGHRWAIFGLLLVVGLLTILPLLIVPVMAGVFTNPAAYAAAPLAPAQLLTSVLSMVIGVLFAVILASIYVELRTIKEGVTSASLAQIFA